MNWYSQTHPSPGSSCRSSGESGAAAAGSVLHHHSIVLCHDAHIDKLELAHAQNSKLEKTNTAMAVLAVPCPTALLVAPCSC